jgi:hypothetical protein
LRSHAAQPRCSHFHRLRQSGQDLSFDHQQLPLPGAVIEVALRSSRLLSAAIQAIPTDQLDNAAAERLVASVEASLEILRRIKRHLGREVTVPPP